MFSDVSFPLVPINFPFGLNSLQLKVMEERNMKPHASTLAALSVQCSKELELDLAEALLDQVCECPHPYPYNAFLGACDTMVSKPHTHCLFSSLIIHL